MAHWMEQDQVLDALARDLAKQDDLDTWHTKDGRDIPIQDMSDDHLLNAERFLRGEGEQDCGVDASRGYWRRKLDHLRCEISRRALSRLPASPRAGWMGDPSADQAPDRFRPPYEGPDFRPGRTK